MPTVPVIQTQVANVGGIGGYSAPQAAPVIDQRPQMIQQAGQAMSQSAEQWAQLEAMQRRRVDIAAHTERLAAIGEQDTNWLVEGQRLQGKAAVESFDGRVQELDKRYKAALESAPEGHQREWLRRELAERRQSLFNAAVSHREKELLTWRKGSTAAAATQAEKAAIAMLDAEDRQDYINKAIAANMEAAEVQGLSDEERNLMVKGALARIHGESIRALVQGERMGEAAAYLNEHRGDLDPTQRPDFEVLVKRGVTRDVAYSLATTVLQSANGDPFKAQESLQQLFNAKEIDSNMLDMAEQRVMRMATMEANQREVENAQVVTNAEQWLAAPENRGRPLSDNPELYESVAKAGKLPQLLSFQEKGRYTNSPEVLSMLGSLSEQDMASVSPEAFHGMVHGNLTPSQEAFWKAKHRAATGRASKADRTILTMEERITKGAIDAKVLRVADPNAMTEDESVRFEAFKAKVDDNLQKWQTKNKREPSDHEITTEIIDPLVADQVVIDGEKRSIAYLNRDELGEAFLVVPGRAKPLYLRDIPPARIDEIVRKWDQIPALRGKMPTWEAIGQAYAMMIAQGIAQEGESMAPINYSDLPSQFRLMPTIKPPRKHSIARGLAFPY